MVETKELVTHQIDEKIHKWQIGNNPSRDFVETVLPYGTAYHVFKPELYNFNTGKGEQRNEIARQANKIKNAVIDGTYTPTPIAANVRTKQREIIVEKENRAIFELSSENPLALTDGQQRFAGLKKLLDEAIFKEDHLLQAQILSAPISATIYLNGNTQRDFINFQLGSPVDKSMLLCMESKLEGSESLEKNIALKIAKISSKEIGNPFYKQVRFDVRSPSGIPINSLCQQSSSDLSTSLIGLAKVRIGEDEKVTANLLTLILNEIEKDNELTALNSPLTPPPNATKGSATMIVGLGICLAYRMFALKKTTPSESCLRNLLKAAQSTLKVPIDGNFSAARKRELIRDFSIEYFAGLNEPFFQEMPIGLLKILTPSSYGCDRLPREENV